MAIMVGMLTLVVGIVFYTTFTNDCFLELEDLGHGKFLWFLVQFFVVTKLFQKRSGGVLF